MATPIVTEKNQFQYDIDFTRDGETKSRSFTIDAYSLSGALSSAQQFQAFLAGQGGLSVTSIVPNEFIQPAGWRDNNPDESPWTTTSVGLTAIKTTEIYYGKSGGGGGGGGGERTISVMWDSASGGMYFTYDGQLQTDVVKVFDTSGEQLTVRWDSSYSEHYVETGMIEGHTYTVIVLPTDNYALTSLTFVAHDENPG